MPELYDLEWLKKNLDEELVDRAVFAIAEKAIAELKELRQWKADHSYEGTSEGIVNDLKKVIEGLTRPEAPSHDRQPHAGS